MSGSAAMGVTRAAALLLCLASAQVPVPFCAPSLAQAAPSLSPETFCVDYSAAPDIGILAAHDVAIVHPNAALDFPRLKQAGTRTLAYLSAVEVAPDASYRSEFERLGIPVLATNATWKSLVPDIRDPKWKSFVLEQLAPRAAALTFDGFFLDTLDSVALLELRDPASGTSFQQALLELVRELRARFPTHRLVLNRGFDLARKLGRAVDGVLIESLFQTFDAASGAYTAVPEADTQALLATARQIQSQGTQVYALDYVDPANAKLALETAARIQAHGLSAFISTPALDGHCLAPLREQPRTLLALYGNLEHDVQNLVRWPVDSVVSAALQTPIEWLGLEVDFLNPFRDSLPAVLPRRYAGIILDRALRIPASQEMHVAQWLLRQKRAGHRILFFGILPFQTPQALRAILDGFGIRGDRQPVASVVALQPRVRAPQIGFETEPRLQTNQVLNLAAPEGARPWLSLEARSASGSLVRFDPVFIASWGGLALDPYLLFRRADEVEQWALDPFALVAEAFDLPPLPAVDTTTRDGRRVFFSHIDGDGFRHFSSVEAGKRSGQIVVDRILKKYPFDFTVSIVEAEIRGLVKLQHRDDETELVRLAREMFALPNVRAASHSFSHPFFWMADDRDSVLYEARRLELKPEAGYSELNLEREINGSIDYLQRKLLPPGKNVELFLWTGNCRPPPEALRRVRALGIENMNGGDTTITRKHPSITRAAPRSILWDNEVQIFAANQNENVYQERWHAAGPAPAPFVPGFIHALDTFALTESPRRLKPVNVYFHFYSADSLGALRALSSLLDYALSNDVHCISAADYSRSVRDARSARIFRDPRGQWLISSQGRVRTFRLPGSHPPPSMTSSRGITGFAQVHGATYVHTDGSSKVLLNFEPDTQPHLRLESSTAPIQFDSISALAAGFSLRDLRPATVIFAGLPPNTPIRWIINDETHRGAADAHGRIRLDLPATAKVRLAAHSESAS